MNSFSVLLSVYYQENPLYFRVSLDSIFNQTVLPTEIVLVKDGPLTSELDTVIEEYKLKYPILKILPLIKNVGLGKALNEGLKYCSYDWVARMDSDDICFPYRFEKQLQFLSESSDIAVFGTSMDEFILQPGDIESNRSLPTTHSELKLFAKKRNPFNHPTVMFNKKIIENVGSYQKVPLFEDYHLWLRVLNAGYKIANISEPLLYFRVGNDMIGRRHGYSYVKKEFYFYKRCVKENLLSKKDAFFAFFTRLPMRLIPKKILSFLYKKYLRK
jgi:glycosyltransferase involved in cell wall biosynthesis